MPSLWPEQLIAGSTHAITKQELINASWDANVLEHIMNDSWDQPNPPYEPGTVKTRLGNVVWNINWLLRRLGSLETLPTINQSFDYGKVLTAVNDNGTIKAQWQPTVYELVAMDSNPPANPQPGWRYYNTANQTVYIWDETGLWISEGNPPWGRPYWSSDNFYRWNGTNLVLSQSSLVNNSWPRPQIINPNAVASDNTTLKARMQQNNNIQPDFIGYDKEWLFGADGTIRIGNGTSRFEDLPVHSQIDGSSPGAVGSGLFRIAWGKAGTYYWQVPANVFEIVVTVIGAGGGSIPDTGSMTCIGQLGNLVQRRIKTTPGNVHTIIVGAGTWGGTWAGTQWPAEYAGSSFFDDIEALGGARRLTNYQIATFKYEIGLVDSIINTEGGVSSLRDLNNYACPPSDYLYMPPNLAVNQYGGGGNRATTPQPPMYMDYYRIDHFVYPTREASALGGKYNTYDLADFVSDKRGFGNRGVWIYWNGHYEQFGNSPAGGVIIEWGTDIIARPDIMA